MTLAKTTRPTLGATVARPRLFRLLDRARRTPVTWVWGPPGAGKTTLVASYLAARRLRIALVSGGRGRRRRRDLLLLSRSGRAPPAPAPAAPDAGVPSGTRRLRAAFLPGALLPTRRLASPSSSTTTRRSRPTPCFTRSSARRSTRFPEGRARHLHQPERAAGRLRPSPGPREDRDPRLASSSASRPPRRGGLIRRLAPGRWSRKTIGSLYESVDGWVRRARAAARAAAERGSASAGPGRPVVGTALRLLRGGDLQEGRFRDAGGACCRRRSCPE